MIIGLTGTLRGGKGLVAEILRGYGFLGAQSYGGEVRKEARLRGIALTRPTLQELGAKLRIEKGVNVWSKRIEAQMQQEIDYVIDGMRYPEDAQYFRSRGNFALLAVDAPFDLRYKRARQNGREGDSTKTLEEFRHDDANDLGLLSDCDGQNVAATIELADHLIWNDGARHVLQMKVERILSEMHYSTRGKDSLSK